MDLDAGTAHDQHMSINWKNIRRLFPWYSWIGIMVAGTFAVYGFIVALDLIGEAVVQLVR
jgi:hypothetical protein